MLLRKETAALPIEACSFLSIVGCGPMGDVHVHSWVSLDQSGLRTGSTLDSLLWLNLIFST